MTDKLTDVIKKLTPSQQEDLFIRAVEGIKNDTAPFKLPPEEKKKFLAMLDFVQEQMEKGTDPFEIQKQLKEKGLDFM